MEVPAFEQKRVILIVHSLYEFLDSREAQLLNHTFSFVGPPSLTSTPKRQGKQRATVQIHSSAKEFVGLRGEKKEIQESEEKHLLFSDVKDSHLIVTPIGCSSINIQGSVSSVFKLKCDGPVFIHDMQNCVVQLDCHQARLHNMHNCIVIVDKASNNRVVIEDCDNLNIIGLVAVDDFSWPTKISDNPHFKLTHGSERLFDDVKLGKIPEELKKAY